MSDTWRKHSVGALARAWWVIVGAWRPGRPGDWILREGILMFGPNVTLALQRNTLLWKHKPCKPLCHTTPLGTAAGEVIIGENYTLWIYGMEWKYQHREQSCQNSASRARGVCVNVVFIPDWHGRGTMQIIQCQDIVTCHEKRDNDPVSHTPTDMDNAMLIHFYCVYILRLAMASFQKLNW